MTSLWLFLPDYLRPVRPTETAIFHFKRRNMMSDSVRPDETSRPEGMSEADGGDQNPRREFLKTLVTAVAGLTLASAADAQPKKNAASTVSSGAQKALA